MELQTRLLAPGVSAANRSHHALADWLVTAEMGTSEGPRAGSVAAARVLDKLSLRVAQLITPLGSEALLKRAVHLSRAEVPLFDGLQTRSTQDSFIDGLRGAAAAMEPIDAHQGFLVVLATLVSLLESFIGQDLTFRLLRDVWPDLPTSPPSGTT